MQLHGIGRDRMRRRKSVVFGTTVGLSARYLLRGQLGWFRSRGWTVVLATSPDEDAKRSALEEGVVFQSVRLAREISPTGDVRGLLRWIRLLRRTRPLATNLGTPKASLIGGLAAWLTGVPRRIYVVWGLRSEGASGPFAIVLWLVERMTIALATDVIVVSPSLGRAVVRRRLARARDLWITGHGSSNGVAAGAIAQRIDGIERGELRARLGIGEDRFVVGFIGRITRDKGVDTLIDAVSHPASHPALHDRVDLLLIGSLDDQRLAEPIAALGDRAHAIGWQQDVWAHLPAIDVLCLPTLREGLPNVVLEAAAAGIPTITTRATGAIDSVIDGETGFLVEIGDAAAIRERVNELAADPELLARLGDAARRRVRRDFSPVAVWEGVEALLQGEYDSPRLTRLDRYQRRPQDADRHRIAQDGVAQ